MKIDIKRSNGELQRLKMLAETQENHPETEEKETLIRTLREEISLLRRLLDHANARIEDLLERDSSTSGNKIDAIY